MKTRVNLTRLIFLSLFLAGCNPYFDGDLNPKNNSIVADTPPKQTPPTLSFSGTSVVSGTVGVEMSISPTVFNHGGGVAICSTSSLPTGLFLNADTCVISGVPTVAQGSSTYTIFATNPAGVVSAALWISFTPIAPTLSFSGVAGTYGTVGVAMNIAPSAYDNGGAETTCSAASLPAGLSVDADTCVISGTPTASSGNSAYTIVATNSAGVVNATTLLTVHPFLGTPVSGYGNINGSVAFDVTADYTTFKDVLRGLTVQPDGKLLLCGDAARAVASGPTDGFIVRMNIDGTLDTTFNSTGKYIFNSPANARDHIFQTKVFNNYIYAFGSSRSSNLSDSNRAMVLRLNMNGTLDTSFGSSGVVFHYTSSATAFMIKGEVLSNGKMIVLGYNVISSVRQYFINRLNADGSLDTTFATGGIFNYPSGSTYVDSALIIDANNKIILNVISGTSADYKTTLIRLNADGSLDSTFGTNGVFLLAYGTLNHSRSVEIHNNTFVLFGSYSLDAITFYPFILKLDEFGVPLQPWGSSGVMDLSSNSTLQTFSTSYFVIKNDQMIISGYSGGNFVLSSLNIQTGTIINTFGSSGLYQSDTSIPNLRLPVMVLDSSRNVLWGAGVADTLSANTLIHAVQFK